MGSEVENLKGELREAQGVIDAQEFQIENFTKQVTELEELTVLMSTSALEITDNPQKLVQEIKKSLKKFDEMLEENFKLKKEIACEKKRYIDLMEAFVELRDEQKIKEEDQLDFQNANFDNDVVFRENRISVTSSNYNMNVNGS